MNLVLLSQSIPALFKAGVQVHSNGYMDRVNPGGQAVRVRFMFTEWCQNICSLTTNLNKLGSGLHWPTLSINTSLGLLEKNRVVYSSACGF